jgi:hypothetical protein
MNYTPVKVEWIMEVPFTWWSVRNVERHWEECTELLHQNLTSGGMEICWILNFDNV